MRGIGAGVSDSDKKLPALEGFEDAHRQLLADSSIQFELRRPDRVEINPQVPGEGWDPSPIIETIFWVVLAIGALALLYMIVRRLPAFRRRRRGGEEEAVPWHMEEEPARQLLGEADALAAQGRYSEAAHLLLHRSIEEIDHRRPDTVRKALTSRDIASLPVLPPSPAQSFGRIVRAVERSLFGGRELTAADWEECRDAYGRFAFAGEWQS
jgi:hypothetical protein